MFLTAKTAISSYGKLTRVTQSMSKLIKEVALKSFYDLRPCEDQAEKICALIEKRNLAIDFKQRVRRALRSLSEQDFKAVAIEYGNGKKNIDLFCSDRTYYRMLKTALAHFTVALKRQGITDETLEEYADKIYILEIEKNNIREKEELTAKRLCNLRPVSAPPGVYRKADRKAPPARMIQDGEFQPPLTLQNGARI